MNDIKVSLFKSKFVIKPNNREAAMLSSIIADKIETFNRDNIKLFANLVGKDGCTFCPATFKDGKRSKETFEQLQLLALDFVKGISFEEVKDRAARYDLPILFAYRMLSSSDNSQFSVIFLNDASVKYAKVAQVMLEALLTIFPEADPTCEDISKMYLGGKRLLYFNPSVSTINIEELFKSMYLYWKDYYGDNHKRYIYEFSNRTKLALTEKKFFDISIVELPEDEHLGEMDENLSPNSIIYKLHVGDKSSNTSVSSKSILYYTIRFNKDNNILNTLSTDKKKPKTHLPHRSSDLNGIGAVCKLFKEFTDGSKKLSNPELRLIATNLVQIESGSTRFMDTLRKHSYFDYFPEKYEYWKYYLNLMKKNEYDVFSCEQCCSYKEHCYHSRDILSTVKPKPHTTTKLANHKEKYYPIDEAVADFRQNLAMAIEDNGTEIHAINAQTALGKSTIVREFMKNTKLKYLVAFSTNDLKNAQYEKAVAEGIKAVKSPSLLESKDKIPSNVWRKIESLYQSGKHHAVFDYIKKVISKKEVDKCCIDTLKEYLKNLTEFYTSNCHAFTTHSRLITLDYWTLKKYDVIIIDEDIILNCMIPNQIEIPLSKLEKILDKIDFNSKLAKKIRAAAEAAKTKSWFTLASIEYDKEYDDISTLIDISSFCLAEKFYFKKKNDENNLLESNYPNDSIVFLKPFKLRYNVKYIILSATVDEKICNYYFGANRVKFYNCKKAKNIGLLNQYDKNTMSRSDIDKKPGIIGRIKKFTGFADTITFKKFSMGNHYYGKTTGIDTLKGKNIDVIGTPHQPEWIYKLFAYTMGFDINENAKMKYQIARHNGFIFSFMTFNETDSLLRNIQLWMIESELEQAVGRARLLRENCTVNLFSNFPLRQAVLRESGYDKD